MPEFFLIVWADRGGYIQTLRMYCAHDVAYGKYQSQRIEPGVKWCEIYCQCGHGLLKIGGYVPAE
ncbi:MAG: hypothetical protein AMXMBFR16_11550 [Candidatus Uhrbacteria bacterium]